jgi:hypothetical protein
MGWKRRLEEEEMGKRDLVSKDGKTDGKRAAFQPVFPFSSQLPVFLQTSEGSIPQSGLLYPRSSAETVKKL